MKEKTDLFKEYIEKTYGKNTFFTKTQLDQEWELFTGKNKKKKAVLKGNQAKTKASNEKMPADYNIPHLSDALKKIQKNLGDCTRCKLSKTRTHIVFGEGNPNAKLLFVGEGPGESEDLQGRPFVGRAGKLLDKIIEAMGMKREDVFIANVVKCRPPENRRPESEEVEACEGFLHKQIAAIDPKVIVALGSTALECLTKQEHKISEVRGTFLEFQGRKLLPTYHPAYLLRNPPAKKFVWDDMKVVMKALKN